ncbi:lipopolysaccharide heptosyltransferase family protein, partial [Klebsiella michiganensis]|nr:lipopolysaccharide heptosyltransferase family protein [Citrobacter portucalensis]MDH0491675.1 lipopolysaccharide heptosyltransferase family protein [Klebsiella michiganensis]
MAGIGPLSKRLVSILISFQILRKAVSRLIFRLLADKPLPTKTPGEKLHILLLRWDAKLGDSIVSSFFFRESRKLNARLTVLTVNELAEMHTNTF